MENRPLRWVRHRILLAVATGVVIAGTATRVGAQVGSSLNDWLETPTGAITLLPPIPVATGALEQVAWSSDGRFLLVSRSSLHVGVQALDRALAEGTLSAVTSEASVVLFDAKTLKTSVLWKSSGVRARPCSFTWLSGGSAALIMPNEEDADGPPSTDRPFLLFRTSGKTITPIRIRGVRPSEASVWAVPAMPLVLLQAFGGPVSEGGSAATPTWIIDSSGTVRPVDVPPGFHPFPVKPVEGSGILFVRLTQSGPGEQGSREAILYDPVSGRFTPSELPRSVLLGASATGLAVSEAGLRASDAANGGETARITLSWESEEERTQASASGQQAVDAPSSAPRTRRNRTIPVGVGTLGSTELSPDGKHVSYHSNGVLFVRPIWTVSSEEFAKIRLALSRTEAMSQAKQVALAMHMYAADYDGRLPDAAAWQAATQPYVEDPLMLEGFVYTYDGPSDLSKVEKPAETVLGYIQCEGGRAVAYVDGHVKWISDPPKT